MIRRLEMDEVRIGMFITVFKGKVEQRVIPTADGPQVINREKDTYKGAILEVLSLEFPYISIRIHRGTGRSMTSTLDLRDSQVMLLTKEYVLSLCPNIVKSKGFNKEHFWYGIEEKSLKEADSDIKKIHRDKKK